MSFCLVSTQAEGACKCNGWKSQNPPPTPPPPTPPRAEQPIAVNLMEPCRSCSHALGNDCLCNNRAQQQFQII